MQKYIKTGLLIIVLVVPVLVFIFLRGFSTNHFDLPYYVPLRDSKTNEVIVQNGDTTFYQLENFSLATLDSQSAITNAQLRGKIRVISAIKGPCGGECETILSKLTRIYALHESLPSLAVLTILTTPDTTLVKKIDDRPKDGWLIASVPEDVYNQALQSIFHLGIPDSGQTISEYKPFSLVDRNGFIRGFYNAREDEEVERLMAEIRVLDYNKKTEQKQKNGNTPVR